MPLAALRRELHEETGVVIDADAPHVWHQEVAAPGHAYGYDGVVNDYFLVRTRGTDLFSPRDIATPLAALIAGDIPDTPVMLGL